MVLGPKSYRVHDRHLGIVRSTARERSVRETRVGACHEESHAPGIGGAGVDGRDAGGPDGSASQDDAGNTARKTFTLTVDPASPS